ncbi:MAG: hypothetical protein K8L91_23450 [Anaerolineae bacterium]|nr:hypothetical protein [Anaerolineae bacterium]
MRWYGWLVVFVVLIISGAGLVVLALDDPELVTTEANVISSDLEVPAIGFTQITSDYEWQFPQDFGPHPDFQREQWEILSGEGCEISFTLLFDRASFVAETFAPERESAWAMNGILQATLTIESDQTTENINATRSSRVAAGLAGADENRVWVADWAWNWSDGTLVITDETARLELTLTDGNEATPIDEIAWNAYTVTGEGSGKIELGEQSSDISCSVTITHRFQ